MKSCTVHEIAKMVAGELVGSTATLLTGVASLEEAASGQVSFLGNKRYADQVGASNASAVLVPRDFEGEPAEGGAWIRCQDPSAGFSIVIEYFAPAPVVHEPGCHPSATVAAGASIPATAHIGACAVVESGVKIGDGTVIGAGCYVGQGVHVGSDCLIYPNVSIRERCVLGDRIIIHHGAVIGSDGFGFIPDPAGHRKIPQVGIVQIDDDVELGANVCIDRARFGRTWIKRGVKVDNLVHIAHNVTVGEHCFIVAQVGISGSTRIGRGVILAGQAGLAGHLTVGDGAVVMAQSGVTADVPAGANVFGTPAMDRKQFARNQFNVKRIESMRASLKKLQAQVDALSAQVAESDEH